MSKDKCFFTVVYPQALQFFGEVCNCARKQTCCDFDYIIVNDGCDRKSIEEYLYDIDYTILESANSIAGNRLFGIEYARIHQYKYLFFCDADDTFMPDRIEKTVCSFEKSGADILVCNLNVADDTCKPIIRDYFSKEIPEERWIDVEFLKTKNIIGMSNTAIRLANIPVSISVPNIPVVDWYLFTVLLLKGLKAYYIVDSLVNYRQYDSNMIGITRYDVPAFRRLSQHKMNHYNALVENGYTQYQQLYKESEELTTLSETQIKEIIKSQLKEHPQPLWWQIITSNNN